MLGMTDMFPCLNVICATNELDYKLTRRDMFYFGIQEVLLPFLPISEPWY